MEEEFRKKLHHRLTSFEKKHKEWEWSDVIKWLSSLKTILEKFGSTINKDLMLLISKRLAQCLNPSLPQGLHAETLEIYDLVIKNSSAYQILMLSSGLFQHFQYCAPQNKLQFLALISENYINKPELNILISGLTACLLSGAGDKQETLTKVIELLDLIENKKLLHCSIWNFIIKSNDYRNAGLVFMQKRTVREYCDGIIINALLESLEDQKVINKRLALDIIKNYYPISEYSLVSSNCIIALMQGVLKLFKGKDYSLIRRFWEWAFPEEINNSQVGLIRELVYQTLILIFEEYHEEIAQDSGKSEEIIKSSIKIVEELCASEEIGEKFIKVVAIPFLKHCIQDSTTQITPYLDVIISQYSEMLWESISEYILEFLLVDEEFSFGLLQFSVSYLRPHESSANSVIFKVASSLHKLSIPGFLEMLKNLIQTYPKCQTLQVKLKHTKSKLTSLLKSNQESDLLHYIFIFTYFTVNEVKIPKILSYLKLLSKKNLVLTLKALLLFEEKSLNEQDFEVLWKSLNVSDEKLLEVLIRTYEMFPEQCAAGLVSVMLGNLNKSTIRAFIGFWQFTEKHNPDVLLEISRNSKIVFIMIELIKHENPNIRHAVREWLSLAEKSVACLIDPILQILLHSNTIRKIDEKQNWFYINNFHASHILDMFNKLHSLLIISNDLLTSMQTTQISQHSDNLASDHRIYCRNYLELLVEITFLYIKTNSTFDGSEIDKVQCSAAELLRLLLKKIPQELVNKAIEECGKVMSGVLGTQFEYSMLPVFEAIFQQKVEFTYPSNASGVLILGLMSDDYYLRHQWSKVITLALVSIFNSDIKDNLCNYIRTLFINYYEIIEKHGDFSIVEGLQSLVNLSLLQVRDDKIRYKLLKSTVFSEIEKVFSFIITQKTETGFTNIISDVSEWFPLDIMLSFIDFWLKNLNNKPNKPIQRLILKLGLTPEQILDGISNALSLKKYNDLHIASLLYTVIEKIYPLIKHDSIWIRFIAISKYFLDTKNDEIIIYLVKSTHLLLSLIIPTGKTLVELQIQLKSLLKRCQHSIIKWEKVQSGTSKGETILEAIFNELTYCQSIFAMVWREDPKKLIHIITRLIKSLIESFCSIQQSGIIISKLLSTLLISYPNVYESIRSLLIDTLKTSALLIIQRFPSSIEYWYDIINSIPKLTVFSSIEVYDQLFFKSSEFKQKMLEKSLCLISLVTLSSQKDTYVTSINYIRIRLEEALKPEKISFKAFSIICICIRVLSIRLTDFHYVWSRLWPELHAKIFSCFTPNDIPISYEILKLIDCLLLTYSEFDKIMWVYLYDFPEIYQMAEVGRKLEYIPTVGRFLKGFRARPKHNQRVERFNGPYVKRIVLEKLTVDGIDEIERSCKNLINYAMLYTTETMEVDFQSIEKILMREMARIQDLIN